MPSHYLELHPKDPQLRLIRRAANSCATAASSCIRRIPATRSAATSATRTRWSASRASARRDKHHHFTLVCRDLVGDRALREGRQPAVPHAQGGHAGAVHVPPAGDEGDAAAPAASHAAARSASACRTIRCRARAAGTRRAAHELDAAAARRRAAADRRPRDPGAARITWYAVSMAAIAASSRPRVVDLAAPRRSSPDAAKAMIAGAAV